MLELMVQPLAACLILVGIHAYLGLHVVKRGVIFVDLALAQVSALGATVAILFHYELGSTAAYWFALAFTLGGAALFSLTRTQRPKVPQEAVIGTVYAVSAAAAILVLSRAPEGGEELKGLLVGHLLFIGWPDVAKLIALYTPVAIVHWFARHKLLLISEYPEQAFAQGLRVRWWDFLFYGTFGVVVTSSVQIAGVLLVFAFLIIPTLCGMFLAQSVAGRLLVAWGVGVATSVAGLGASYQWDLPTGAAVVCTFGVSLAACALLGRFRSA